ncbi:unnamed protein product [Penicillium camemberti]|uniref:Str. FM013 n=1 Tax=Penicillium camemberti (strain FM 013) TaxID=1429867 RepID=A0A0G4NX95_PENC3|nr:unnamed protein product [Penicillium camemberti]
MTSFIAFQNWNPTLVAWLMYYIMRKQACLQGNLCIEED